MDTLSDPDIPKTKAMRIDYATMIAGLEAKIDELQKKLQTVPEEEEDEAVVLYQIWDLLPQLQKYWDKLPHDVHMAVVGAFVRRAILEHPSPVWVKITIEWKIGECDVMHIRRVAGAINWSEEEDAIIREHWPKGDIRDILHMLPTRSRTAISNRAENLRVRRRTVQSRSAVQAYTSMSVLDVQYAQVNQLGEVGKKVYWSKSIR